MLQKLYRYLFWAGYLAVLITAFMPVTGELNRKFLGPGAFHIRLDHLLHFAVYLLICIYYLAGLRKELILFDSRPLLKFILLLLFLAAVTELVQLWVPERAFNVFDILSNVGGLLIGLGVIVVVGKKSTVVNNQ
jgi:VanZ family protein